MEIVRPDYSGMTTNERLFVSGLLDKFDDAVLGRDRVKMIALLTQVDFNSEDASAMSDRILADPTLYGRLPPDGSTR